MSDRKKKARIELIDIANAITIILVILGHTTGNLETPMYRRFLYAFHMPLFFFLAGLSIRPKVLKTFGEWKDFIRKNLQALVVPPHNVKRKSLTLKDFFLPRHWEFQQTSHGYGH